jgi:hypothetical protein
MIAPIIAIKPTGATNDRGTPRHCVGMTLNQPLPLGLQFSIRETFGSLQFARRDFARGQAP